METQYDDKEIRLNLKFLLNSSQVSEQNNKISMIIKLTDYLCYRFRALDSASTVYANQVLTNGNDFNINIFFHFNICCCLCFHQKQSHFNFVQFWDVRD